MTRLGRGVAVACVALLASAIPAGGKSASATFDDAGVTGRISFSQAADGDPVAITVALDGLAGKAGKYHVHAMPVYSLFHPGLTGEGEACAAVHTGGHYNPLGVAGGAGVAGTYACDYATTPASCEAGDLSGKHGVLDGRVDTLGRPEYEDAGSGLTLFGATSVVGRSVVIHAADGSRWVCASILEDGVTYKEVSAGLLSGPVGGFITFGQDESDPTSETWVMVRLTAKAASMHHNWHVHESAVAGHVGADCAAAGGHYNPAVAGAAVEVGDLSGKHGALDVPGQYMFTDVSLPLSGPNAVAGRSLVIHAGGGGAERLVCGTLVDSTPAVPKHGREAQTLTDAQAAALDAVIAAACTVSMIGSLAIMYAQHKLGASGVSMRILYWLSFADVCSDVVSMVGIGVRHPHKYCSTMAFMVTWADLSPIFWTACMSVALFKTIFVDHRKDTKEKWSGFGWYFAFAFGIPIAMAVTAGLSGAYGDGGFRMCWIEDPDLRLYYFYLPLWLTVLFNSLVYATVWCEYHKVMNDRHGVLGETRSTSRAHRLKYYPAVLLLTWTAGSVNRIVETSSGRSHFTLTLLQQLFCRSQGLFNLIVYGTDPVQKLWPWFRAKATCLFGPLPDDAQPASPGPSEQEMGSVGSSAFTFDLAEAGGEVPDRPGLEPAMPRSGEALPVSDALGDAPPQAGGGAEPQ